MFKEDCCTLYFHIRNDYYGKESPQCEMQLLGFVLCFVTVHQSAVLAGLLYSGLFLLALVLIAQ